MAGGPLSSVMSIAGAGLLPSPPGDIGVAVSTSSNLTSAINTYTSLSTVADVNTTLIAASSAVSGSSISSASFTALVNIGNVAFPALTNTVSSGNVIANLLVNGPTVTSIYSVTGAINFDSTEILGNGDVSKFCQVFMSSQGYISQANSVLNSVKNSDILATTFDPATGGMNSLTTGGLNQVSNDLPKLGQDFAAAGNLIYMGNLDDLGLPGELLAQIGRVSGGQLATITEFLQGVGITEDLIDQLGSGSNNLTAQQEKAAYQIMTAVTGETLEQVMIILGITTTGIANMAQLLDPRHYLPRSYLTLLCPTTNGLDSVYLANGAVNTNLEPTLLNAAVTDYSGPNETNSLEILRLIIPADQALANKALARSLQQIKNISSSTLSDLARGITAVETNSDLPAVNNLSTPVPASVQTFYQQQLGKGTGPNDNILLGDVIGAALGYQIIDNLATVSNVIGNLNSAGSLVSINGLYLQIQNLLSGGYGPSGGPVIVPTGAAAGTYASWNNAINGPGGPGTGFVPAINNAIAVLYSANIESIDLANDAWDEIIQTLLYQRINQQQAQINFTELQSNSRPATMSFTNNLHTYGTDLGTTGANEFLNAVANPGTLSGQSLIASLREGRNIQGLQTAGIQLDTQLNDKLVT